MKLGMRLLKLRLAWTYSAVGLMAGAANIITMYSRDMTKVQVPAAVSNFFRGFRPRLAM